MTQEFNVVRHKICMLTSMTTMCLFFPVKLPL